MWVHRFSKNAIIILRRFFLFRKFWSKHVNFSTPLMRRSLFRIGITFYRTWKHWLSRVPNWRAVNVTSDFKVPICIFVFYSFKLFLNLRPSSGINFISYHPSSSGLWSVNVHIIGQRRLDCTFRLIWFCFISKSFIITLTITPVLLKVLFSFHVVQTTTSILISSRLNSFFSPIMVIFVYIYINVEVIGTKFPICVLSCSFS